MKSVILAAGKGTRMAGLCVGSPKPMLPLANRPTLEHVLSGMRDAGIKDLLLVVGYQAEVIEDYFDDGSSWGLKISYAHQDTPTGTGSAALMAEEFTAGEPFILAFADVIVSRKSYKGLVDFFLTRGGDGVVTTRYVDDPYRGAAVYTEDDRIVNIIEKPPKGKSSTNFDSAGVFLFTSPIFEALRVIKPSKRGEYELTAAIQKLVEDNYRVMAWELGKGTAHEDERNDPETFWCNVTTPEDMIEINRFVIKETLMYSSSSRHCIPSIESDQIQLPNCQFIYPVIVGTGSRIESSVIGPNVSIGEGVTIGENALIEHSIIFPNCTIGSNVRLNYAILGRGCRVRSGAEVIGKPDKVMVVEG